ncbi:MAG: tetratricopeptide repeat protein [Desulfohalobiaceae bacterium]
MAFGFRLAGLFLGSFLLLMAASGQVWCASLEDFWEGVMLEPQLEVAPQGQSSTSGLYTGPLRTSGPSLVPAGQEISNLQAGVMLTKLLLAERRLQQAQGLLQELQASHPGKARVRLLQVRLQLAQGKRSLAIQEAERLLEEEPSREIQLELADIFASLGLYGSARDIYQGLLRQAQGRELDSLRLLFAERCLLWGDFIKGEETIREYLEQNPEDPRLNLLLARNLMAQQRFRQASRPLRLITNQGPGGEYYYQAWAELIELSLQEKDFARAESTAQEFLRLHQPKQEVLLPAGRAYFRAGHRRKAQKLLKQATQRPGLQAEAFIWLARIQAEQGDRQKARHYLARTLDRDEEMHLARILDLAWSQASLQQEVHKIIDSEKDPAALSALAEALVQENYSELAQKAYQTAWEQDRDFFPAGIGLAEVLASRGEYARSLEILEDMLQEYPGSLKLRQTKARVLAWSGEYRQALDSYSSLYKQVPDNYVLGLEAARTAYWGKIPDKGQEFYRSLLDPAVDELLLQELQALDQEKSSPSLSRAGQKLEEQVGEGSVYSGYQGFKSWYEDRSAGLPPRLQHSLQEIFIRLDCLYQVQKKASLEGQSKDLVWNRRFAPARRKLQQLTRLDPGNQEAWFDLAQSNCVLGLCDQEKEAYQRLLQIDPLHGQAQEALERQNKRSSPRLLGRYSLWQEEGRGDLARMTRHRADLGLELPVFCRHKIRLLGHRYLESAQRYADSVQATGITLEAELLTGPYITLSGGITRKVYAQDLELEDSSFKASKHNLQDQTLGHLELAGNMDNYATLFLSYAREQEAGNAIALAQGISSDRYKARLEAYPQPRLDLGLETEYRDYSDQNQASTLGADLEYIFSRLPKQFRTRLSLQHRDSRHQYQGCSGPECSMQEDFQHPYWTPVDHWMGSLAWAYRRDLAQEDYCGARQHFYDLELKVGTQTQENHFLELNASWQKEFARGLGVKAQAMWHESRDWDAAALELGLFYRF